MRNRIKELREARGITQGALGDMVDVSRQTIISIERGRYNPSAQLAYRLAKAFGLSIEEVFIFDDED
jgi:putative transcriptional regulator